MSPQEIEKLLGGYATDTLTAEERRALFEAALGNQALFDALADEQALRELLDHPASRAHLLAALRQERLSGAARWTGWMRRPVAWGLAGAAAAAIVVIAVVLPHKEAMNHPPEVAMLKQAPPAQPPAAVPQAPAPLAVPRREERVKRESPKPAPAANVPAEPTPEPPAAPVAAATPPPAAPAAAAEDAAPKMAKANTVSESAPAPAAAGLRPPAGNIMAAASARDLYYAQQPSNLARVQDAPRPRSFGGVAGRPRRAAAARLPGLRYSILKRQADGSFVESDPGATLSTGDELRIRFEANQAGSLIVMERQAGGASRQRLATPMREGEPVYVPADGAIRVPGPGEVRFIVKFSRAPQPQTTMHVTPELLRENVANATYVVNRTDADLEFEIALQAR